MSRARSCTSASRELVVGADAAELRLDLPFAEKGEISKKIGLELVSASTATSAR